MDMHKLGGRFDSGFHFFPRTSAGMALLPPKDCVAVRTDGNASGKALLGHVNEAC